MASEPIPTRSILAKNVQALMDARPNLDSNPKLAKRISASTATISRIRNAETDCTLDTLDKLAAAFEISAWQLLVPGLGAHNYPVLRTLSPQESDMYERLRSVIIHKESDFGDLPSS